MMKTQRCWKTTGLVGSLVVGATAIGTTLRLGSTPSPDAQPITNAYYVDSYAGDDANDGRSPATAWQTLAHASERSYKAGEQLLLSRGRVFEGTLRLEVDGSAEQPVIVGAYAPASGALSAPVIDAAGYLAAVQIQNGRHVIVRDLELTADGGEAMEERAHTQRYGVLVEAEAPGEYPGIQLRDLNIHDIFATVSIDKDGQNPTSNMGMGIGVFMLSDEAKISDVVIERCNIAMTGHTGIRIFGANSKDGSVYLRNIKILDNYLRRIGGPGMVPGRCQDLIVRGNVTDDTGSDVDPRMHNRGSGIWPWTSKNVLIEHNKFMHAFGKYDSHGAHIDFNCENVVVQYNLSINNHGGFVEILGNNKNCSYRYNISINDGWRVKGELGALSEGNALWTSGYTGRNQPRIGPHNSYIYNNTIYIKADQRTCFSIVSNTDGIYIANNIFHILGETHDDSKVVKDPATGEPTHPTRVVFKNNVFVNNSVLPESLSIKDSAPIFGDVGFRNPGGFKPEDYIPTNIDLVKDKGLVPEKLPEDPIGLTIGLEVREDILGNPIKGVPDIGAIELQ